MNTANRASKITYTIKRMTLISGFQDIIKQLLKHNHYHRNVL